MHNQEICNDLYRNFISSKRGKEENIYREKIVELCTTNNFFENKIFSVKENPLIIDSDSKCKLISNKRTNLYSYMYDGKKIVDAITESNYTDEYINKVFSILDINKMRSCCNCINLVLYISDDLEAYLYTTLQSVLNVETCLPKWVVRIYVDLSVYNKIKEDTNLYKVFNRICESPSVEIYTYICKENLLDNYHLRTDYNEYIEKTTFLRLLSLKDSSIKTSVIRDSKKVITLLDCKNISTFEKSNKLLFLSPFVSNFNINQDSVDTNLRCSNIYKKHIRNDYFEKNNNIHDIYADFFSCNIKIKKEKFLEVFKFVTDKINKSNLPAEDIELLRLGFDELFLLELFKDLISCNYNFSNRINYDDDYKKFILSNIVTEHNFKIIDISTKLFYRNKITANYLVDKIVSVNNKRLEIFNIGETKKKLYSFLNDVDNTYIFKYIKVIIDYYIYREYETDFAEYVTYQCYIGNSASTNNFSKIKFIDSSFTINNNLLRNNIYNLYAILDKYIKQKVHKPLNNYLKFDNKQSMYAHKINKYQSKINTLTNKNV